MSHSVLLDEEALSEQRFFALSEQVLDDPDVIEQFQGVLRLKNCQNALCGGAIQIDNRLASHLVYWEVLEDLSSDLHALSVLLVSE